MSASLTVLHIKALEYVKQYPIQTTQQETDVSFNLKEQYTVPSTYLYLDLNTCLLLILSVKLIYVKYIIGSVICPHCDLL